MSFPGLVQNQVPTPDNNTPTSFATYGSGLEQNYSSYEEAFPDVDPGREPCGVNVLVQIRQPKTTTKSGLKLVTDTRSAEYYNTRVGRVIAFGPLCFKSTIEAEGPSGEPVLVHVDWPEGPWFKVGDHVEIPQYGGQRFVVVGKVKHKLRDFDQPNAPWIEMEEEEEITFAFFKAKDIIARITCDPLKIKAYAD